MRKKTATPLIAPRAMATPTTEPPEQNWYRINASASSDTAVDVMIYDDIGGWGITAKRFARELAEKASGKQLIRVALHSLGGDVLEGLAIYNLLKNHPARVEVTIGGIAASMGSVIAMAGDVVYIPANAWVMIHKPWGVQGGNADELREYADFLDQFEASLVSAYTAKTGLSAEELAPMLAAETWLMGEEAVNKGFADQLTEPLQASASLSSQRFEDFASMPKQAKSLVAPQGSGTQTPAPQQPVPQASVPVIEPQPSAPTPAAPAAAAAPDQAVLMAQFQQQEQGRRDQINALFQPFAAHAALRDRCLNNMDTTPEQAQTQLLAALGKQSEPAAGGHRADARVHAGNGAIVRQTMANALGARAGVCTLEDAANPFHGMILREMARASLSENGISAYGMDAMGVAGMAFTHSSSDFGNILSDVAQMALLKGAEEAEETFQRWTKKGQLSDFKVSKRVGLESFPTLDLVKDGGEYKYATLNDTGETIQLATYGKLFSITRQTIINDDLNAFTEIPNMMARAALRTVGNLVYAQLMDNPKMSDGKPLFDAAHNNLLTAATLSAEALDLAATAMAKQTDSGKAVLNIEPQFLIVPRALKGRAKALMASQFDPDGKHANSPNIAHEMAEVIADARIDAALAANTKLPWFLAAAASTGTIEVAYLDGNDTPQLEQQEGWNIDGTAFKVRLDAGVSPLSYRTLAKNPGA